MGIGYGLIQGLTGAARGINQGKADARELERQAREAERKALHDALAQKLLEAQINKMNAPAPVGPGQYFQDDEGNVTYSTEGGPGQTVTGVRGKRTPTPVTQRAAPGSPEDLRVLEAQARARAAGAPDRPQSAAEVAAQDQLPTIEQSYNTLAELNAKDPRIGNRVIAKANKARQFSLGRVGAGIIGKLSGTRSEEEQKQITEEAIINSLSPDEARWYAAQGGFLSGTLPALGGKTVTISDRILYGGAMFPTGDEPDESLAEKWAALRARYEATRRRAGVTSEVPERPGQGEQPKYRRPR